MLRAREPRTCGNRDSHQSAGNSILGNGTPSSYRTRRAGCRGREFPGWAMTPGRVINSGRVMNQLRERVLSGDTERGNTTLLSIGLLALILAAVLAIATAASVHLERKRLWNLAGTLALEISDAATYETQHGQIVNSQFVAQRISARIAAPLSSQEIFDGLRVGSNTDAINSELVRIHLRSTYQPGTLPWMLIPWSDGIEIEAESTANISN